MIDEKKRYNVTTYKKNGFVKRAFIELGNILTLKRKYPKAKIRLTEQQPNDSKI